MYALPRGTQTARSAGTFSSCLMVSSFFLMVRERRMRELSKTLAWSAACFIYFSISLSFDRWGEYLQVEGLLVFGELDHLSVLFNCLSIQGYDFYYTNLLDQQVKFKHLIHEYQNPHYQPHIVKQQFKKVKFINKHNLQYYLFPKPMSKPITISLENLNSLYFKFINQFVLQHLPKDIYNDVVNLLSLKSAVQTYRFLDKLLGSVQQRKGLGFGDDKRALNSTQQQKGNTQADKIYSVQKKSQNYPQNSNNSNQGSTSYVDKDDFKYQNDLNTIKKPPTLLKRTHTYQSPQKPPALNYESYNFGQARLSKQKIPSNNSNKEIINLTKSPHIVSTNVVKHDYDTISEKQNVLRVFESGKRDSSSKNNEEIRGNINSVGDSYSFKDKGRQSKEKSDQNLSANNGYRKTQFSKTYSIKQPETKLLTASGNISNLTSNNNISSPQSTTTIINRLRFHNLIRQTKQIFSENAKKIARYEKISINDSVGQQNNQQQQQPQQKTSNDSSTSPFSPESGNSYTYMYRKY